MEQSDEQQTRDAAAAIGLDLPAPCLPGVIENRALLDRHRRLIEDFLAERPET